MKIPRCCRRFILVMAALSTPSVSIASPDSLCDTSARIAAVKTGIPLSILRAITLAETGHGRSGKKGAVPWPWAIHSAGRGHWFADEHEAVSFVQNLIDNGERNIDIGCFQLNLHWHSKGFSNLHEMLDPDQNALYAAHFLQELYLGTGDWKTAVGQYHSRDKVRAQQYVTRLKLLFETTAANQAISHDRAAFGKTANVKTNPSLFKSRAPLIHTTQGLAPLIGGLR